MNDVCAYTILSLTGKNIPIIYSERNDPNKTNQSKVDKIFRKIVEFGASLLFFKQKEQNNATQRKYKENQVLF